MRKVFFLLSAVILITVTLAGLGCKKSPPPPEETLRISTNAAALNETPGPDFEFNLTVESAMPKDGVRITFVLKGETDNQNYPQGSGIVTVSKITKVTVFGLPRQKYCVCTITVTSLSKATNIASTSFRLVYK